MTSLIKTKFFYPRGSEWRKWDPHVHSPLSILSNNYPKLASGEPDWEKFIKKLEELDFAVIGITDYFTIEGYKKVLEFKNAGRLKNIHTILPNIEFRLSSVISSRKDGKEPRRLNFHVILSDEISPQDIEDHFLHDLHFFYQGNPQSADENWKLKLSNLKTLGEKLISQHTPFQGRDPLELGATNAVVDHQEITEILTGDSRFKGKYLLIFPEELSNLIDWDGQDHLIRKGILQKSDMVFSSNPKTIQWCLGKDPYTEGEKKFKKEFVTLKPCIHGSDSHSIDEIGKPCAKRGNSNHKCNERPSDCDLRYCWIKSDPTFEGLRQLLYEPEDRVSIQSNSPSPARSNFTLEKLEISETVVNKELSLSETKIDLNPCLIAVAGGKGTGKTAFVDLIAGCYFDRVNTDDENSFVRRILDQKPKLNITLGFKDKSTFSKAITDIHYCDEGQIAYIAQGELERYIGDKSDLDTYVNNLIFQCPKIQNSVEKYEYLNITAKIKEIEQLIQQKSQVIESLELATRIEVIEKAKIKEKQNEALLRDNTQRIKEIEKQLSTDKVKIAQQKQEIVTNLKNRRDLLIKLKDQIKQTITFLDQELPKFNSSIISVNNLLKSLQITETFSILTYQDKPKIFEKKEYIEKEISKVIENIGKAQKEIENFETGIRLHASLLDKKREIEVSLQKAKEENQLLEEKKKQLQVESENRKKIFTDLISIILESKNKYTKIIKLFSSNKVKVLSDLDFIADVSLDAEKILKNAEDVVDNRKVIIRPEDGENWVLKDLIQLYKEIVSGDETKIKPLVDETERLTNELKDKIKLSSAISLGDLYKILYRNYLTVIPVVKYKKTSVNKLSLGQKATVLIKIYLAEGDKPIIIDSHDDHLDNEYIMEELISSIREAKKYRQIILVSNNGNVVINSDAEQTILAERDSKGKISYISGSIEAEIIRNRAINVLEGGPEAFKKRQQKYRM